jgi:hypothetical protein
MITYLAFFFDKKKKKGVTVLSQLDTHFSPVNNASASLPFVVLGFA